MSLKLTVLFAAAMVLGLIWSACGGTGRPAETPADTFRPTATNVASDAVRATPGRATPDSRTTTASQTPIMPDSETVEQFSGEGYMVLAPSLLRPGQSETISVSLFSGQEPGSGTIRLALLKGDAIVSEVTTTIEETGSISLPVPDLSEGIYNLLVEGPGFTETAQTRVASREVLFIETDKPIYKPGQELHIRVLLLDVDLKPVSANVNVEVLDAKGNKVFRQETGTDEFGMANLTMPLSAEPNLGVWKILATREELEAQTDARVERYVLPKYEVDLDLPKEWFLVSEPIAGTVSAEYTFGKPVRGEVQIIASKYVGEWEEFATFTQEIDGDVSFELPAAGYVAGVPAAGGRGNITLDVAVSEVSTGYVEETTMLLTAASSPLSVRLIPESPTFKPSLPYYMLVITETPDNRPVESEVTLDIQYYDEELSVSKSEGSRVTTVNGKTLVSITPPENSVAFTVFASAGEDYEYFSGKANYSPTGSYIHLEQIGASLNVGDLAQFIVHATKATGTFYYEIVSKDRVVFSDVSRNSYIGFTVDPAMAPVSKLVVYQILPDGEVAADYIPFDIAPEYPMDVTVAFSNDEVRPGDGVEIDIMTRGKAKVGLSAVDRSVFILAEKRLNLQQVFAELERLYLKPQAELHELNLYHTVETRGSLETFNDSGLIVMTNLKVPHGQEHRKPPPPPSAVTAAPTAAPTMAPAPMPEVMAEASYAPSGDLAEVQRVRQYFPETWIWADMMTDDDGHGAMSAEAPDSITTWMMRAVALSKEHGLGISEAQLRVFQPFFLEVDLPYSAIRGEEFSVKVALYNYLDSTQDFSVDLEGSERFTLLDDPVKSISIGPNNLGSIDFKIRLTELGQVSLKVTARSRDIADAVVKELLVEPEGVHREIVNNLVVSDGDTLELDNSLPQGVVPGSARTHVAMTGNYLSQTLEGLESLLQLPYGCGEQNMVLFAPNVYVARYLEETGQSKPEIMAKAEHLMVTGYQRELIYQRHDGSFSAFGDSDESGSLWLTAFVLKTFAQAQGLIYVDIDVLRDAVEWIVRHQRDDGSFQQVGFVHDQGLLGGVRGSTALTAYVAIALLEAGVGNRAAESVRYLESKLSEIEDPYAMAIVAYALALGDSGLSGDANDRLIGMAVPGKDGLHWKAANADMPEDQLGSDSGAAIETTAYSLLALLQQGDLLNAGNAARWLVTQRNAFGGYSSTQDTVVGLQALIQYGVNARLDTDMTIELTSGDWNKSLTIDEMNADVVQIVSVPVGEDIRLVASGSGQAVAQLVHRFNLPSVEAQPLEVFEIDVDYSADQIEMDDLLTVSASVRFVPMSHVEADMTVLDIAVPTGFMPVTESLEAVVEENAKVKRYDLAGRKVILYIENMAPNDSVSVSFTARALHPIRAQPVKSQVYSYYKPHWRAESLGERVTVE